MHRCEIKFRNNNWYTGRSRYHFCWNKGQAKPVRRCFSAWWTRRSGRPGLLLFLRWYASANQILSWLLSGVAGRYTGIRWWKGCNRLGRCDAREVDNWTSWNQGLPFVLISAYSYQLRYWFVRYSGCFWVQVKLGFLRGSDKKVKYATITRGHG